MRKLLDFLCRFSKRTRILVAALLFLTTIISTWVLLVIASQANDPRMMNFAAFISVVFAMVVTPIIVSIVNEQYEADGIYGMFVDAPPARPPMH